MQARFPQPVRVGDLIGLPMLDDSACTLGHVREVVRTPENKIELIVSYGGLSRLGRASRRRTDRSRGHHGSRTGVARYAAKRIRDSADLAGCGRAGAAQRRDDQDRAGPALSKRSRLGEVYNFLVFADL